MKIKTVGDLKSLLQTLPDDAEISVCFGTGLDKTSLADFVKIIAEQYEFLNISYLNYVVDLINEDENFVEIRVEYAGGDYKCDHSENLEIVRIFNEIFPNFEATCRSICKKAKAN